MARAAGRVPNAFSGVHVAARKSGAVANILADGGSGIPHATNKGGALWDGLDLIALEGSGGARVGGGDPLAVAIAGTRGLGEVRSGAGGRLDDAGRDAVVRSPLASRVAVAGQRVAVGAGAVGVHADAEIACLVPLAGVGCGARRGVGVLVARRDAVAAGGRRDVPAAKNLGAAVGHGGVGGAVDRLGPAAHVFRAPLTTSADAGRFVGPFVAADILLGADEGVLAGGGSEENEAAKSDDERSEGLHFFLLYFFCFSLV